MQSTELRTSEQGDKCCAKRQIRPRAENYLETLQGSQIPLGHFAERKINSRISKITGKSRVILEHGKIIPHNKEGGPWGGTKLISVDSASSFGGIAEAKRYFFSSL